MTPEDKELLIKDLCARIPNHVKVELHGEICTCLGYFNGFIMLTSNTPMGQQTNVANVKPYLRRMESMTEEEEIYYNTVYTTLKFYEKEDWLLEHHFDYRVDPITGKSMIDMGLAEEAPEGMYKIS